MKAGEAFAAGRYEDAWGCSRSFALLPLTCQPLQTFIRPSFTVPASAMLILTGDRNP
jgi:hypothetical protein